MIQHECSASLSAIVSLLLLSFVFAPILSRTRPIRIGPIAKCTVLHIRFHPMSGAHIFDNRHSTLKLRVNGQYAACLALLRSGELFIGRTSCKTICVRLHLANGILSCICKLHVWATIRFGTAINFNNTHTHTHITTQRLLVAPLHQELLYQFIGQRQL